MKYAREIKIGLLTAVCLFLLFFGFNFLKGVNIFSPTNPYYGRFEHLHGLEEQAPVFIRGYKVGHVNAIHYDYARVDAYRVDIAINKDIDLPEGTQMVLMADGILGGMAIELDIPDSYYETNASDFPIHHRGDCLETAYMPGLVDKLQDELIAKLDTTVHSLKHTIEDVDSLVLLAQTQLEKNHLRNALANIDWISSDLTDVSDDLRTMMAYQVPAIVNNADTAIANLNTVVADIRDANLKATVARADTVMESVNNALLRIQPILGHVDAAVISADSLLKDLKANPKRYVQFSVFGKKDKK